MAFDAAASAGRRRLRLKLDRCRPCFTLTETMAASLLKATGFMTADSDEVRYGSDRVFLSTFVPSSVTRQSENQSRASFFPLQDLF